MITQLHDMGSARQSAKMAVKNHQKPTSPVVFEMMAATFAVPKTESNSGFSCQIVHCIHREYGMTFLGHRTSGSATARRLGDWLHPVFGVMHA
jgi:hypothetical protein